MKIFSIIVFSVLTYVFFKHDFAEAGYFSAFYLLILIGFPLEALRERFTKK